jgi:hypothetical protein
VLQPRGFAGLVLLSRTLPEEATPDFRKPSSVQGHLNCSRHWEHLWVLDRPIVDCRSLSLGWRVASYDHDVEVVRIFTIHTSFDPAGVSGQGLPSHKAHIAREQLKGVQRISLECFPFLLALPYQNRSGSPAGGQLCGETINLKVLQKPDSGLGLVFCGEVTRERKD